MQGSQTHRPDPASPDLLDVLDAMVRADGGVPGFSGRIAVGVRPEETGAPRWWVAQMGARARGGFVDAPPKSADAWLALGAQEAKAALGQATMPERPNVLISGDRRLLDRFFRRYVQNLTSLALRAGMRS